MITAMIDPFVVEVAPDVVRLVGLGDVIRFSGLGDVIRFSGRNPLLEIISAYMVADFLASLGRAGSEKFT